MVVEDKEGYSIV